MDLIAQEALQNYESNLIQSCLHKIRPDGRDENIALRELYEDAIKIGRIRERLETEMREVER